MPEVLLGAGAVLALLLIAAAVRWAANDPGRKPDEAIPTEPEPDPWEPDPWEVDPLEVGPLEVGPEGPPARGAPDAAAWIAVLRGGEPGKCREAVEQLVEIGEPALPALLEAARDEDPDLRFDVRRAIRLIRGELPE